MFVGVGNDLPAVLPHARARDPLRGDRYCCPIYPPPGGVGIPRNSCSRDPGRVVNMSVDVGNDLPTVLPHATPRLKSLMAPHWCCRVTPRTGFPGGRGCRYPGKTLLLEKLGVKVQGGSL